MTQNFRLKAVLMVLTGLFLTAAASAHDNSRDFLVKEMMVEQADGAKNHVRVYAKSASEGDWVAIIPSLGRGVEDYTEDYNSSLTIRLARAGFRVLLIQPRGIGKSTGTLDPAETRMDLLAGDLLRSFDAVGAAKVTLVGHAFGNRLSRFFATQQPARVAHVVLIASGGNFEMSDEQIRCLSGSFNLANPEEKRIEDLACAFFAKGNDPSIWLDGWYPRLAMAQIAAATNVDGEFFKRAGGKPILLIQPGEDFIAPPELSGRVLAAELGEQVTYAEVPFSGHAITSEQPDIVAALIIEYLRRN